MGSLPGPSYTPDSSDCSDCEEDDRVEELYIPYSLTYIALLQGRKPETEEELCFLEHFYGLKPAIVVRNSVNNSQS